MIGVVVINSIVLSALVVAAYWFYFKEYRTSKGNINGDIATVARTCETNIEALTSSNKRAFELAVKADEGIAALMSSIVHSNVAARETIFKAGYYENHRNLDDAVTQFINILSNNFVVVTDVAVTASAVTIKAPNIQAKITFKDNKLTMYGEGARRIDVTSVRSKLPK